MRLGSAVMLATVAGSALAGQVKFTDAPGGSFVVNSGTGGAWNAITTDRGTFATFCVELNEHVTIDGSTTYDYVTNSYATMGGIADTDNNPGDGKDYLSDTSRNIYYAFRTGVDLSAYGDTPTEINDVIQLALWNIEESVSLKDGSNERLGGTYGSGNYTFSGAAQALINAYNSALLSGAQRVQVMNLTQGAEHRQDMLTIIPLPGASGLACAGLLGMAVVRRRRA